MKTAYIVDTRKTYRKTWAEDWENIILGCLFPKGLTGTSSKPNCKNILDITVCISKIA